MEKKKVLLRKKRKFRVRKKISGTSDRPRLSVFRSNRHMSLQVIDDIAGKTLVSAQTVEKELKSRFESNNIQTAAALATILAERAKARGISTMVFDRNGYAYHGRVKQIAESLRKYGIKI